MNRKAVTVVRIYTSEGRRELKQLMQFLEQSKQRFTLFRGTIGSGVSGQIHKSTLLDIKSELPMIIEFFDAPDRIEVLLTTLETLIKPDHILTWSATIGN